MKGNRRHRMGDNVRLENHWRNPADLSVMLYHQEGAVTDQVLACRSVLYTAQCTLHTVQCTLYTTYCTLFTALCTLTTVHCTMYAGHCYKIDHTALPSKNYGAYWTCQTTNSFFRSNTFHSYNLHCTPGKLCACFRQHTVSL